MTWLTATEYLCRRWALMCLFSLGHKPRPILGHDMSLNVTYHQIVHLTTTTRFTTEWGTAYTSQAPWFNPWFLLDSCCSIFSFLSCFLWTIIFVCVLVLFRLAIALSVLRSTSFEYPFDIFKFSLWSSLHYSYKYYLVRDVVVGIYSQ